MREMRVSPPMRELTQEEVVAFFESVGARPICSACGHGFSAIHIRHNDSVSVAAQPSVEIDNVSGIGKIELDRPTLTVVSECDNCGLYRQFSYIKILNWANARRDAK